MSSPRARSEAAILARLDGPRPVAGHGHGEALAAVLGVRHEIGIVGAGICPPRCAAGEGDEQDRRVAVVGDESLRECRRAKWETVSDCCGLLVVVDRRWPRRRARWLRR